MNEKILRAAGVDYAEGVARFSGHAFIYEKCLRSFLNDKEFGQPDEAMAREDYEAAFRSAHALKGVVGNLSMNSFYEQVRVFVDLLRGGADIPAAREAFPALKQAYQATLSAVQDAMKE